jgi:hypothetical protein
MAAVVVSMVVVAAFMAVAVGAFAVGMAVAASAVVMEVIAVVTVDGDMGAVMGIEAVEVTDLGLA